MTYPTEQPSHKAMTRENPSNQPERLTDSECEPVIAAYLAGNQEAAERLSRLLDHHARITAEAFLKQNQSEVDDVIQDTVIAVMAYLKRRGEFSGSVVNFTISVARNRCRNYLIWKKRYAAADLEPLQSYLASRELGPLDTLAEKERHEFLQEALDHLEDQCRDLLRGLYIEERSVDEMRREANLKTFQSIYYRRARCLKNLAELLNTWLLDCSWDGESTDV